MIADIAELKQVDLMGRVEHRIRRAWGLTHVDSLLSY
jgi:hypothetical protein